MKKFGLIGKKLSHSFSKKYFSEKFENESIDAQYDLYELPIISEFKKLKSIENLIGLNVTIPYKQEVIPYLDEQDDISKQIGAVNTIKFENGKLKGYNSDYYGFRNSLEKFIPKSFNSKALVLGTGGASKAVQKVLEDKNIGFTVVSRNSRDAIISYSSVDEKLMSENHLIINTTPLGMHPIVDECPDIPYQYMTNFHYCFDLVYNPKNTLFMNKSASFGAHAKNGLEMLHGQAEKSWEIWNS